MATTPTEISQRNFGNFTEKRQIGQGSYGTVYQVSRKTNGAEFALKDFHTTDDEGLEADQLKEILAYSQLSHPNIACLCDIKTVVMANKARSKELHLVFPLAKHGSLAAFLQNNGSTQFLLDNIPTILCQMAAGVAEMHAKRFLHCDLKPANMLLFDSKNTTDVLVQIADLGMATYEPELSYKALIHPGYQRTALYTYWYRPPELWIRYQVGFASDVWALGICMLDVLTDSSWMGDLMYHRCRHDALREKKAPILIVNHLSGIPASEYTQFQGYLEANGLDPGAISAENVFATDDVHTQKKHIVGKLLHTFKESPRSYYLKRNGWMEPNGTLIRNLAGLFLYKPDQRTWAADILQWDVFQQGGFKAKIRAISKGANRLCASSSSSSASSSSSSSTAMSLSCKHSVVGGMPPDVPISESRARLLGWMFNFAHLFDLRPRTVFSAIDLFQRTHAQEDDAKLTAVACLGINIKLLEFDAVHISQFVQYCACDQKDIVQMEMRIVEDTKGCLINPEAWWMHLTLDSTLKNALDLKLGVLDVFCGMLNANSISTNAFSDLFTYLFETRVPHLTSSLEATSSSSSRDESLKSLFFKFYPKFKDAASTNNFQTLAIVISKKITADHRKMRPI